MRRCHATTPAETAKAVPPDVQPGALSSTEMDAAVTTGQAAPLSQTAAFLMRYKQTWWLSTQAGWLPVPRQPLPSSTSMPSASGSPAP